MSPISKKRQLYDPDYPQIDGASVKRAREDPFSEHSFSSPYAASAKILSPKAKKTIQPQTEEHQKNSNNHQHSIDPQFFEKCSRWILSILDVERTYKSQLEEVRGELAAS